MTIKRINKSSFSEGKVLELDDYPRIRHDIETVPMRTDTGSLIFGLRDQLNHGSDVLWLPRDLFYLLQFFDGRHSGLDIKMEYMRKYSDFLFDEDYIQILQSLDENYFLDNERSKMRTRELTNAFRQLPHRPATCAGSSYPSNADDLAGMLDALLDHASDGNNGTAVNLQNRQVKAVVAPHIDIRLGGTTYAHAYKILSRSKPADLYVILGIGHQGIANLFSLTTQDFETPLGLVRTDKSLVENISMQSDYDFLENELIHRDEHSIEFQTIFLKHFVKSNFRILPILCSFSHSIFSRTDQSASEKFRKFIKILKSSLAHYRGSVCIIASVDFSHIGIKYGDRYPPTPTFLAQAERNDRQVIETLIKFDRKQFQQIISENDNRYRICGYSALATLFELLSPSHAQFLDYSSAVMDEQRSRVSFASFIFT